MNKALAKAREAYAQGEINLEEFEIVLRSAVLDQPVPQPKRSKVRKTRGEWGAREYMREWFKYVFLILVLPVTLCTGLFATAHYLLKGQLPITKIVGAAMIAFAVALLIGCISAIFRLVFLQDEHKLHN